MLAELVKQHWKKSTFNDRVAFGVKTRDEGSVWLVLQGAGDGLTLHWSRALPLFDAALGLDDAAAAEVLCGRLPRKDQLCIKTGDEQLLAGVLAHYFDTRPLAVEQQ